MLMLIDMESGMGGDYGSKGKMEEEICLHERQRATGPASKQEAGELNTHTHRYLHTDSVTSHIVHLMILCLDCPLAV